MSLTCYCMMGLLFMGVDALLCLEAGWPYRRWNSFVCAVVWPLTCALLVWRAELYQMRGLHPRKGGAA